VHLGDKEFRGKTRAYRVVRKEDDFTYLAL
jgi:hypothetical protein